METIVGHPTSGTLIAGPEHAVAALGARCRKAQGSISEHMRAQGRIKLTSPVCFAPGLGAQRLSPFQRQRSFPHLPPIRQSHPSVTFTNTVRPPQPGANAGRNASVSCHWTSFPPHEESKKPDSGLRCWCPGERTETWCLWMFHLIWMFYLILLTVLCLFCASPACPPRSLEFLQSNTPFSEKHWS